MNTFLKFMVTVVALTVLFIGAIMFFDKKVKKPIADSKKPAASSTAELSIRDLDVLPAPDGALIKIGEVKQDSYEVRSREGASELIIAFPKSALSVKNRSLSAPHALVQSVEATEETEGSQVRIVLAEGVTYKSRVLGSALYIDVVQTTVATEPVETPMSEPMPVQAPPSFPSDVAEKPVKRSKPKPKKQAPPPQEVAVVEPTSPSERSILDELNIPTADPSAVAPAPEMGLMPLDPMPSDTVASLPKGDFDATLPAGLPRISNLTVNNEGGVTRVYIDRDARTKFKVIKQVNPSRVVVEFLNAANALEREYGGFPGTRVQRVMTEQFAGPDGAISRITFFVEGEPNYDRDNGSARFVLTLP